MLMPTAKPVCDVQEMVSSLEARNGGEYSFLGVLGWFNHNLFATQGVYPPRHGCEQMAELRFSHDDHVLRFPTTLYVSMPGVDGEAKKSRHGTMEKGWPADNGDLYRVAFVLAVAKASEDRSKHARLIARLRQCANNVIVLSGNLKFLVHVDECASMSCDCDSSFVLASEPSCDPKQVTFRAEVDGEVGRMTRVYGAPTCRC